MGSGSKDKNRKQSNTINRFSYSMHTYVNFFTVRKRDRFMIADCRDMFSHYFSEW
jgi:hypothetical protein